MRYLLLLFGLYASTLTAAPRVVTSIPPLQELTAAIMSGVGEPGVIIEQNASVHHFALKPSQMRQLQQADLVIWIDRHFEHGFDRIADTLPRETQQLELLPAMDIRHGDGHLWYSAQKLQQSAGFIVAALKQLDPVNRSVYEDNAVDLRLALAQWSRDTATMLAEIKPSFITDHQFLDYFARDFKLDPIVPIHDVHDDHGGIRELQQIEVHLRQNGAQCLLQHEPTLSPLVRSLVDKYRLRVVSVVPPVDDSTGLTRVLRRLQQLTRALEQCG